ncbi:MAG TPA: hypothetical protein VNG51_25345 [Ktedonobacteraceae bacterium]|nr:hypothetical protein [Ktedonobacteraceae bacterium]
MEYLFSFSPYDDDYEEGPTPEDDDGEEKVTPQDSDPEPEDNLPANSHG